MTTFYWVLSIVVAQRLVELAWAARNTARLRRLGAIEADAAGYPLLVALHAGWLVALLLLVPAERRPDWLLLGLFALLQLARIWIIRSLGRFWTTRVMTLPGMPLVRSGPYRRLRHPNYLLVVAEIAVLPLAFGAVGLAAAFSALNLMLVARRVSIENRALAPRRAL